MTDGRDEDPVLVLGATGDLGSAVARCLHARGVPLVLHGGKRRTELAYLRDEVGALSTVLGDLSTAEGIDALASALDGIDGLAGVVNCTGVNPMPDTVDEIAMPAWQETLDVNLTSVWRAVALALPRLKARGLGAIVLVSSVFGVRTPARRAAYGASKHALVGLAQALAQEGEGAVRANVVAPGAMWGELTRKVFAEHARLEGVSVDEYVSYRTARIPGHRFVTVDQVARVCAFLASTESVGINGQCIVVDGGEF